MACFCLLTFVGARARNVSISLVREMVETPSVWKSKTSDPCQYQMGGNPSQPNKDLIKVNFFCGNKSSYNTLSLAAIPDLSVSGVLKEVANINGFDVRVLESYKCNISGLSVTNKEVLLTEGNWLECKI